MRRAVILGGSAAAAALAASRLLRGAPTLPSPVGVTPRMIDATPAGRVAVYSDGPETSEPPVLLVHGVHAAASTAEMRPLFEALCPTRRVLALDLPGFGHSERGDRDYSPRLLSTAIQAVLEDLGAPAHLVALSLGSELAARVAADRPELAASLTLISPTGLGPDRGIRPRREDAGRAPGWLRRAPVGPALFGLLATRPSIRYFLSRSFAGPVDPVLERYCYLTAHQPGARFAPLAFVAGRLFTPGAVERIYGRVRCPALVIHDTDPFASFARLDELTALPTWSAQRISPAASLPHYEHPQRVLEALQGLWDVAEG